MPHFEIIRCKDLMQRLGLSRATLWRRVKSGEFPKPLRLGGKTNNSAIGWLNSDVENWLEEQQKNSTGSEPCKK